MNQCALETFHRHLQARGLRASTQETYVACLARLIARVGKDPASITSADAYAYLVEQSNRLRPTASWYNVIFTAVVRWFEMRGVALDLRGLQPQRRLRQPPRWLGKSDVHRLIPDPGGGRPPLRRDVRGEFLPEEIPDAVIRRVLTAANQAPSVGFMQPWSFILVRSRETRQRIKDDFAKAHAEATEL